MPFVGNQPAQSYSSFAKQDFTTSATTAYTLSQPVANENEIALFINFVRQEPTTAYTASGTSLTLTSATSASDDMYCVFLGKAVQTVNPPVGSVGTAQIADDAVTKDKLSAHNYPAFEATLSASQSIPNTTATKVQFNTENYDTNGYYDNATNYRFTPLVAGKYFVYSYVRFLSIVDGNQGIVYLYKNGSSTSFTSNGSSGGTNAVNFSTIITQIIHLNGSTDYIEAFVYQDSGSNRNVQGGSGGGFTTTFGAYRIGD